VVIAVTCGIQADPVILLKTKNSVQHENEYIDEHWSQSAVPYLLNAFKSK